MEKKIKKFYRIKLIRKERNIRAKELAEKMGYKSTNILYKKENLSVPFTDKDLKIASEILKCKIDKLVEIVESTEI
ncbi:MAG: helix-turn-helix transcriptional regulator [Clostridia bacterium]|nr:helix-turn-helix transcriptional regulator [Clostridia bacterium]MBR0351399.1 helix-turn-helix transcriptional regulator [Clostridia bacterium]